MRYVLALLGVLVGAAAVVAGEADDSPGLQGLGVLLAVGAVAWAVRTGRRARRARRDRPSGDGPGADRKV